MRTRSTRIFLIWLAPLLIATVLFGVLLAFQPTQAAPAVSLYRCYATINGVNVFSSVDSAAVQKAINVAQPGDKVKVAGTCVGVQYHEYMNQVAYITQTLTVEGGYTTTNWLVSNPVQYPTVLDADLQGRVIFATEQLTVANLTIQNGYAAFQGGQSQQIHPLVIFENGGGIATDHDVWLDNVDVVTNTAQYGGGVYAGDRIWPSGVNPVPTHNVWVRDSLFRNNTGTGPDVDNDVRYGGGGIYVDGSLTAIDTDFIKNGTMGDGGALSIRGDATVTGGRFDSNTTDNNTIGSGAAVAITGTLTISGVTVTKNVGGQTGGAVIADGDLTIINSLFQENVSAEQSAAAVRTYGNGVIINSQFYSNTSYTKYPVYVDGVATIVGAAFIGNVAETDHTGALYVADQANIEVSRFERNFAGTDGGAVHIEGPAFITDTDFLSNTAESSYVGALYAESTTNLKGCLFQGNSAGDDTGAFYSSDTATLVDTDFVGNTSALEAGAMYAGYGLDATNVRFIGNISYGDDGYDLGAAALYIDDGPVSILDSLFEDNHANGGYSAGAIYAYDVPVYITNTQFLSNSASAEGGAIFMELYEGSPKLRLTNTLFQGNSAADAGGAIFNKGANTRIANSVFVGNWADSADGGAIANDFNGLVRVIASTFTGNTALADGMDGGAIYNAPPLTALGDEGDALRTQVSGRPLNAMSVQALIPNTLIVDGSTFNNNMAFEGGAVRSRDFLSLSNSTFSGNMATDAAGGSALRLAGTALITNVTVVGNSAPANGAVRVSSANGYYTFYNTIIAHNTGGGCSTAGGVLAGGFNIETDGSCGLAFTDVANAVVGVLGDYGGPTWTMPLLPGSPALNAGDQFSCMAKDQRGVTRPQGVNCDIGAFESQGFIMAMDGGDNQSTAINTYFAQPLVASVTGSTWQGKQEPVDGGIVDFAAPISTTASISEGPEVTVTIDSGLATLWAVANSLTGSYQVTGTADGATGSAIFHLENTLFPSEVRVSSSANPVVDKQQPFSLTVEVMMQSPPPSLSVAGLAVPTGTVHIVDTTGAISLTGELIEPFRVSQICLADAAQTGGCGLPASYVIFDAPVLPAGTYDLVATYDGNYQYDPSTSEPFVQVVLQSPVAVNDAAGALQDTPVTIAVLANDIPPTGDGSIVIANGFIVSAVGSATHGVAVIDPGAQTVTYTPAPGFSGLDTFTYTARASNTGTDDALVAVVVAPLSEADVPEQVSVTNPEIAGAHFFTSAVANVRVDLPAGFFTGTLGEKDVLFLSYTPIFTPTANTGVLPGQLKFGHFEFDLTMHLNDQVLEGYQFPTPYTLTITYDGAIMSNLKEETLVLYIWDGAAWVGTGINLITRDIVNHVLVVTVDTTGQFAFFAEAPTDIDPEPEPDWANHLYMPGLYDQDQPAGEAAAPVEQAQPIEQVLSPFEMLERVFMPAMEK